MTTKIVLFHSSIPSHVPPEGLFTGEIAFNVADGFQFIGYGGDVNYDVYGNPLEILPPPGRGWKIFVIGGGDQPGPPGPGVPTGGETGQILGKLTDGDYVTGWIDNFGPAQPSTVGVVYGLTTTSIGGNSSVALGFQAHGNIGTGVRNTALGFQAGLNQNNVSDNVVVGHQAAWNIDGNENTVIGSEALGNNPGGIATGNVAVGYKSGYNLTEGDGNIFIGYESGINIRAGDGNTIIGRAGGSSDLIQNVIISDGYGDVKFWANQSGAWSTDGIDFGTDDFVLTSQGPNLPPVWKEIPLGFVSRIIAGDNITISPTSGTGIVTINAITGGGTGSVTSIRANAGLKVSSGSPNPITTSGGLEVDYTQVLGTYLYDAPGKIIYGGPSPASPVALPIGTVGQVLVVGPSNTLAWDSIEGASPATPTIFGTVYGSTSSGNTYYGYGAGVGPIGTGNTLIGLNAGTQVGAGSMNTLIGGYSGFNNLSGSVAISNGSGAVRFFANSFGAWSLSGDAQFGLAGQVLSSQGQNSPPEWVTPINAPIQTVNDGPGISTSLASTTLTINNTGILSVTGFSPIIASNVNGNVSISAPNVLSDIQAGTGISIAGTGNSRTISNSGVVSLTNGTNTTVTQTSPGIWQVNASGGGSGSITSLVEGAGINITNPLGPNSTITNSGVLSIQDGPNIVPNVNSGNVTLSVQNVVLGVTASSGITIGGTAANPTIANSGVITLQNGTGTSVQNVGGGVWQVNATGTAGVTKIVAGNNISLSPTSGIGEVTITASGGGGGGSITEIKGGTGITVNSGTGPITTLTNSGVISVSAGTNTTISGTPNNPVINAVGSLNNLTSGKGISITNPTGPNATIVNTGVVGLEEGGGITIQETAAGSGVFSLSASGGGGAVASVSGQGAGISISPTTGAVVVQNTGVTSLVGTTENILVSGSTGAVTLNIGSNVLTNVTAGNSGITIDGTGNSRTISAAIAGLTEGTGINLTNNSGNFTIDNTGVLGLTQGANVTITPTAGTPGNFTISATGGGGGGTGTVTSVATGFGLTGGTITTSGTLSVNSNDVVTYNAYKDKGGGNMPYGDSTNYGWTGRIPQAASATFPAVVQGFFTGPGTFAIWGAPAVHKFADTSDIIYSDTGNLPGVWQHVVSFTISQNFIDEHGLDWGNALGADNGNIPYAGQIGPAAPYKTLYLQRGNTGQIMAMGTRSSGGTDYPAPVWIDPPNTGVLSITGTSPIQINNTTPSAPVISFDLNTTSLTQYIPKSAFNATSTLLVGSGVGTFSTLAPGNNGQLLSVASDGSLVWADVVVPPSGVTTLTKGNGIVFTVNGSPSNEITSEGTISIDTAAVLTPSSLGTLMGAKGSLLTTSPDNTLSRLAPPSSGSGQVLSYSGTLPSWVNTLDAGTY